MRLPRRVALSGALLCSACVGTARGQFPPLLDLLQFTAEDGIVLLSDPPLVGLNFSPFQAGDINDDGFADLILAAGGDAGVGLPGTVYVLFGGPALCGHGVIDLGLLAPPAGFHIDGPSPNSEFGDSHISGVDFNADGIDDLAVGASLGDPPGGYDNGQAFVIFGHAGIGADGSFDLATLDGTNGFVINGEDWYDYLGYNGVAGLPLGALDFNDDGYQDLTVQAFWASAPGRPNCGRVYVIFGGPNMGAGGVLSVADLDGSNGVTINGLSAGSGLGELVVAGDVNGDGLGDLLFGLEARDAPGRPDAGVTYVLFGGTPAGPGGVIELGDVPGNGGYVIYGPHEYAYAGYCRPLGDINGDGVDDVFIQDNGTGPGSEAYVVFGGPDVGASGVFDLADLDGTNGFVIQGRRVKPLGDINGDGLPDLAHTWQPGNPPGRPYAGISWVAYAYEGMGASGVFVMPDRGSEPAEDEGFTIWGPHERGLATVGAGMGPDINGDGVSEFTVSSCFDNCDDPDNIIHASYFVFGRSVYALGDIDRDFDVDLGDFAVFGLCFAGADNPPAVGCEPGVDADFDNDLDVDLSDFAIFAQNFTGAK